MLQRLHLHCCSPVGTGPSKVRSKWTSYLSMLLDPSPLWDTQIILILYSGWLNWGFCSPWTNSGHTITQLNSRPRHSQSHDSILLQVYPNTAHLMWTGTWELLLDSVLDLQKTWKDKHKLGLKGYWNMSFTITLHIPHTTYIYVKKWPYGSFSVTLTHVEHLLYMIKSNYHSH